MAKGETRQVFHVDLAGLDLGQIEDVVDQAQEVVAVALDGLHGLLLLGPFDRVGEDVGVSQDGGHGGANLVAHVGQELALRGWQPRQIPWPIASLLPPACVR